MLYMLAFARIPLEEVWHIKIHIKLKKWKILNINNLIIGELMLTHFKEEFLFIFNHKTPK